MDGGLGAPLGGETAHTFVGILIEAQEVADHALVQSSAVRVGFGQVGDISSLFLNSLKITSVCG